jgi:hypothetical protein
MHVFMLCHARLQGKGGLIYVHPVKGGYKADLSQSLLVACPPGK